MSDQKNKLIAVKKRDDQRAIISSNNLKEFTEKKIKKVYVGALRCIEIRFGDSFDGYEQLRREILRIGNDAIREFAQTLESSFNVEQIPNVLTFKFTKERADEKGQDDFQGSD